MRAGIFNFFNQIMPAFFSIIGHERNDHGSIRKFFDYFSNFAEVNIKGTICDELNVIKAHHSCIVEANR